MAYGLEFHIEESWSKYFPQTRENENNLFIIVLSYVLAHIQLKTLEKELIKTKKG